MFAVPRHPAASPQLIYNNPGIPTIPYRTSTIQWHHWGGSEGREGQGKRGNKEKSNILVIEFLISSSLVHCPVPVQMSCRLKKA